MVSGRIAGISGILAGLLPPRIGDAMWRAAFIAGLLTGGVVLSFAYPAAFAGARPTAPLLLIAAGLLVGVGTRLGNGCTSGHGVCGLARRSGRSLVATLTFMTTGALTAYVVGHVLRSAWW